MPSAQSGQIAYAGHMHGAVYVVAAGEEQGPFDAVGPLVYSQGGEKLAYIARRQEEGYLLVDGVIVGSFEPSLPEEGLFADYLEDRPSFSRDGSSVACVARRDGMEHVLCNAEYGPPFVYISGAPAFSPSSGSLVYGCAEPGSQCVVLNHARAEPFERIWSTSADPDGMTLRWLPRFNADGTRVVFGALAKGELRWKALPC